MKKEKCENCGDPTNLKLATGDRAKKRWCTGCYRQWEKGRHHAHGRGPRENWKEGRGAYGSTPYDSR